MPGGSLAQHKERIWRVGFVSSRGRPADPQADYHIGLPRGLTDLGYVEGRNLVIEWRFADGKYERFPSLVQELIEIPVDVIVTDGTPSTMAAQKATKKIPIVFGSAGDPVGNGLVQTLARPGGNTTGIALLSNDTSVKQLEFLHAMIPGLKRVAVLSNPGNPYAAQGMKRVQAAGEVTRIELLPLEVRSKEDIERAFQEMTRLGAGAFLYLPDSFFFQQRHYMAQVAAHKRIPAMGPGSPFPEAGALMSYGQNMEDNYRLAATYVDKILKGAKPSELPVQQPTKLELVINKKTATLLGLKIPDELLLLAEKVIE
jgi:putative ABC transport system substrate-binding protein